MILTRWINVRLGAIVLVAILLQLTFFSYLSIFGTSPDFVVVVIAVIGLLGGAVIGAVTGFAAGLLLDVALLETLGVSSLVLLSVGYSGRPLSRELRDRQRLRAGRGDGGARLPRERRNHGATAHPRGRRRDERRAGRRLDRQGHSRFSSRLSRVSPDPPRSPPGAGPRGGAARRSTRTAPAARAAGTRRGFIRGRRKRTEGRRPTRSRMSRAVVNQ